MVLRAQTIRIYLTIILCLGLGPAIGAEDDVVLLTIQGNLIGLTEPFNADILDREEAIRLVNAYHHLLPQTAIAQIEPLYDQTLRLIPDFQVAYAAADSAEITDVMSKIDSRLAAMQKIYTQHYTPEVVDLLNEAYRLILPAFGDE